MQHDISGENYLAKAIEHMKDNGGTGFVICRRDGAHKDYPKGTPRQWGAWRAYYRRLGKKLAFFDSRAYHNVPAEWPADFDAAATVQGDMHAADLWEDAEVKRRAAERFTWKMDAAARKAAVARAMKNFGRRPHVEPWDAEQQIKPPLTYTPAELAASRDRIAGEKNS